MVKLVGNLVGKFGKKCNVKVVNIDGETDKDLKFNRYDSCGNTSIMTSPNDYEVWPLTLNILYRTLILYTRKALICLIPHLHDFSFLLLWPLSQFGL